MAISATRAFRNFALVRPNYFNQSNHGRKFSIHYQFPRDFRFSGVPTLDEKVEKTESGSSERNMMQQSFGTLTSTTNMSALSSSSSNSTNTTTNNKQDVLTTCLEAVQKSMLSVGSGDGSQQEAIVKRGLTQLQVTFNDTKSQLVRKYPHAQKTLAVLESLCQHPPRYNVDATKIDEGENYYPPQSFDLIFFTFPHTGIPNNAPGSIPSNQTLLRGFLRAAAKLLKPNGEIQITMKNGQHYEQWKLPDVLNKHAGLELQSKHKFNPTMFPGYNHRLTTGMNGSLKVVPDKKGAQVYVFGNSSSKSNKKEAEAQLFYGKLLTIVEPPASFFQNKSWSDDEVWTEVYVILESFCAPSNVLEIRRHLALGCSRTPPDTRQLNRIMYAMERSDIVQRHAPSASSSNKSQKPRWTLIA
jgi:hypothetical protein